MSRELTIDEAAERVGVGIRTVRRWFDRGLAHSRTLHVGGGRGHKFRVRILEDDLLAFDRELTRARRQKRLDAAAATREAREALAAARQVREARIWECENPAIAFSRPDHRIDPRTGWCLCMSEAGA